MSDIQKTRELPPLTIHSNSRETLAHAEKYAKRKKLDEFLVVDIDAHVSEGMFWNEVTDRIPSNVWKYNAKTFSERGLFYRADHFSLAKRGVPPLLIMGIAGASDLVGGGKAAGQAWIDSYTGQCYHQTCDVWSPDWNLAGAVQDVEVMRAIGADLANSRRWPAWKPGSEFKAVRDATAGERK